MVEFLFIIGLGLLLTQMLSGISKKRAFVVDEIGLKNTRQWESLVNTYAWQLSIPNKYILGIIYTESRGDNTAKGYTFEKGLMQLTENALIDIGLSEYDMFNPGENIHAGTKYLKHLFDKTGNLNLAIRAYNAGYSRVKRNPKAGQNYLDKVLFASELFT